MFNFLNFDIILNRYMKQPKESFPGYHGIKVWEFLRRRSTSWFIPQATKKVS